MLKKSAKNNALVLLLQQHDSLLSFHALIPPGESRQDLGTNSIEGYAHDILLCFCKLWLPMNHQDFLKLLAITMKALASLLTIHKGMSCPSWQLHSTGSCWSPVWTLPVATVWRPCGVTWDSSRTVVVIKLQRTSALKHLTSCLLLSCCHIKRNNQWVNTWTGLQLVIFVCVGTTLTIHVRGGFRGLSTASVGQCKPIARNIYYWLLNVVQCCSTSLSFQNS